MENILSADSPITCLFGVCSYLLTKTSEPTSNLAPLALVYLSKIYFVSQQQIRLSNYPSDKCLDWNQTPTNPDDRSPQKFQFLVLEGWMFIPLILVPVEVRTLNISNLSNRCTRPKTTQGSSTIHLFTIWLLRLRWKFSSRAERNEKMKTWYEHSNRNNWLRVKQRFGRQDAQQ